jgi:dihydroorotate dehydrogenase (fumarate)
MTTDLTTKYLGLTLESPLVAAASPCTGQPDVLRRLESFGAGAVVLPSLFEEQIVRESQKHGCSANSTQVQPWSEFPYLNDYNRGPENYTRLVEEARQAVSMPIIASLNAVTPRGWSEHARRIADAGADALELNLYFVPTDPNVTGQEVETQYLDIVAAVHEHITIPLAVKIGPFFSSLPNFAQQVVAAGADGLVLFNRFLEPELNLERQTVESHLQLSRPAELRLALRWLAILRGQQPNCSLAATGGVHSGKDALKALAAGADVVMIASALLKHGAERLQTIRGEMIQWLSDHEYSSISPLIGSISHMRCETPSAFERANYATTLASFMDHGPCPN